MNAVIYILICMPWLHLQSAKITQKCWLFTTIVKVNKLLFRTKRKTNKQNNDFGSCLFEKISVPIGIIYKINPREEKQIQNLLKNSVKYLQIELRVTEDQWIYHWQKTTVFIVWYCSERLHWGIVCYGIIEIHTISIRQLLFIQYFITSFNRFTGIRLYAVSQQWVRRTDESIL